jgi:hypothetical protein
VGTGSFLYPWQLDDEEDDTVADKACRDCTGCNCGKSSTTTCTGDCGGCSLAAACGGELKKTDVVDTEKLPCTCESPQIPELGCQYHDAKAVERAAKRSSYKMTY